MKLKTMDVVILVVLAAIFLYVLVKCGITKEFYSFLGGTYTPAEGGSRAELNEECLMYPGNQFCMLTDGTSGVCVQNGYCVADMLIDHRKERDDIQHPFCVEPLFKEGCGRFCRCQEMKGLVKPEGHMACVDECKTWFHPSPTEYPI